MRMRVTNHRHIVTFDTSGDDGQSWKRFDRGMEVSGYHHNVRGGFLMLRPGLYSAGAGATKFRDFRFSALTDRRGCQATGAMADGPAWPAGRHGAVAAALCRAARRHVGILTCADAHPQDYPTVQAVDYLGQLLAERTEGRLGAKVYAGGQLGNESDTLEITSFGGLDLNRVNVAPLNSIEPITIPIAAIRVRIGRTICGEMDGDVGEEILASLDPHG